MKVFFLLKYFLLLKILSFSSVNSEQLTVFLTTVHESTQVLRTCCPVHSSIPHIQKMLHDLPRYFLLVQELQHFLLGCISFPKLQEAENLNHRICSLQTQNSHRCLTCFFLIYSVLLIFLKESRV